MNQSKNKNRSQWVDALDTNRSCRITIFALLFFAGIVARLFVAWTLRDSASSDHGVPCLMAKHIATGVSCPVFYYGQPYMGSLEPMFSALFCRIFGINGFIANLGTVIFGIALLPIVYAWGRKAGGALAGLTALLFCVVGPFGFFQFQGWSYGGYAAIVFFCALLVFGASLIVSKDQDSDSFSKLNYFWIGLAAGAAWWTAPHTLPAIVTAAIILLAGVRIKLFGLRTVWGVAGFVIGSLPFWVWNYYNDWATFSFLASGAHSNVWNGIKIFFGSDMLRVLGVRAHIIVWIGYVIGCVLFAATLIRQLKPHITPKALFCATPLLYLIVASLLAGGSRFAGLKAPERYLLHLIPSVAVMLGCITAFISKRLPWGIGLLPVLIIFGWHLRTVPVFLKFSSDGTKYIQKTEDFASFLSEHNIENVYAPYPARESGHALNFVLNERFLFSDPKGERYAPYRKRIEVATSVAVLNNLYDFTDFIESTHGTAKFGGIDGLRVHYDIHPPKQKLVEINASVKDSFGNDLGDSLGDGDLSTTWSKNSGSGQADMLEFQLDSHQLVHAVHLYSEAGLYAHDMRLEWLSSEGKWHKASNILPKYTGYFWSGNRYFFRSNYYRQEYRFEPVATTAVRLYIDSEDKYTCELSELRLYAASDEVHEEISGKMMLKTIAELGLNRVYTDRWMANRIYEKFGDSIATTINERVSKTCVRLEPKMRWTEKTGMLAPNSMRGSCEMAIAAAGFKMSKKELGWGCLYYFGDNDWTPYYSTNNSFVWTGVGCLKRSDRNWAGYLNNHANHLKQQGHTADALNVLKDAVSLFPSLPKGMDNLIAWSEEIKDTSSASKWKTAKEKHDLKMSPQHLLGVTFGNIINFKGVTLTSESVKANSKVDIDYFWECDSTITATDWAVFVHFVGEDGDVAFQDDHVLLENESISDQPVPVLFREQRQINLPSDIKPGLYKIRIGVYGRANKKGRLPVKSEFSNIRKCANLPIGLNVTN